MPKIKQENIELYNQLYKEVKKANQRLLRLEREYGKDTWAAKKLHQRLDTKMIQAWTKTGRVRLNKSMTTTELKAVQKAVTNFIASETSKVSGVRKVKQRQIHQIRETFKNNDINLTNADAESFYDIFDSADSWIYDVIPPSTFQDVVVAEAIKKPDTEKDWIKRLETYIQIGNDIDLVNKAMRLYIKYVEPYI